MSGPDDLKKYLDEQLSEKNKELRQRAEEEYAQTHVSHERSRSAMAVLAESILPYLQETKRAMTGQQLIVTPQLTAAREVVGVAFQICDPQDQTMRSSIYEIDIGTAVPVISRRKDADAAPGIGDDLAERIGVRKFEDLNTSAVERLLKIAIDDYVDAVPKS